MELTVAALLVSRDDRKPAVCNRFKVVLSALQNSLDSRGFGRRTRHRQTLRHLRMLSAFVASVRAGGSKRSTSRENDGLPRRRSSRVYRATAPGHATHSLPFASQVAQRA